LQMPLYYFMAEALLETWSAEGAKVRVEVLGVGPSFAPVSPPEEDDPGRADLDAEQLRAHREGLQETIAVLLDLAASGRFPFNPVSRLCRHCPYVRACRKTHTPTLTRLEAAPGASAYALLRGKSTRAPRLADVRAVPGEEEA
jgi:PD-(D/E)XK nuclease superfamily